MGVFGLFVCVKAKQILAIVFIVLKPSSTETDNVLVLTNMFTKHALAVFRCDQWAKIVAQTSD